MDNQDHKRTHIPAHESHGVHLCHKCGWPFPNPHPSAKHRRAHKRICGTIEGYKLLDSGEHTHSNASDDSDDDHNIPSPNASEMSKNEKGVGGIGEKVNRSEDEVFSDAVADFSDSGLSSDSAISVEKVARKDPKFTGPSEVKGSDAAGVSQSIVKLSDNFQMHSPEVSLSEGVEVGKTLELQGQPSGFIQESSSISDSNSRTEASTVVHNDDSLGLLSNSHISKASKVESMSDVIPETGENVTDWSSTYVVEETNLKGKDDSESDRDMVEIAVSSNNVVGEISERLSKVEVSDEGTSGGEVADGAATLKEKNSVEFSSVSPRDDLLPLDVDSVVNTNAPTNVVQLESEYMSQFATSSDPVKAFQEKEEGDFNVHTLSNPDLAHSQSEFEDYKGPEGKGVALQDPLSLHPSEGLTHEEGDLKETVTDEYNSSIDSNQLTEEKEVLSLDMHVLDDSIKQGCINSEPMVEVIPEVSSVKHTVGGDQRSIEIGTSENSVKSEITNTCTGDSFEGPGSDDVGKNLQHINLPEDRVMVSSDNFEDCMEEVPQNPLNNLHSSEALKDKEDDLKDTVNEESHSNFNLSHMNKESEVISPDMHVLDDSIKQEQVHSEAKVEDTLAEERTVLPTVTLTAESNKKSDEIGASEINVNTEKNESHVVLVLGEQKLDDVCKTSQEKNFPEDSVMASSNENPRDVSIGSSTGQTSVGSIDEISHYEKNTSELDDVASDSKFRGGNKESVIGIKGETIQPSDFLQLEAKTSSDVIKSDYAGERGKIAECDEIDTHGTEGPIVKDNSLPNSGSSQIESSIVSEDMIDRYARKSTGIESTSIDAVSATKEDIKGDKIINNDKVPEECNRVVGTFSNLHQAQDTELSSKTVDNHAGELLSHSRLDTERSAQSVPAVEPSGEAYGISIVTAQDRSSNNLVKFGSSRIDASVESSSRCDSLEGNWGSVSVLSFQSDAPPIMDAEALPSAGGKSNMNGSKAAPEGQRSEKSEMFEPPSFMTLVEPGHVIGQKADASEADKGHNPQQSNPNSSQAGWFPTLTQVVNESQGRKKNEEIIAKVTNWSTSKQHTPLKNLLGEAANSSKPKSPKLEENQASPKSGIVPKDNGSGLTTVNSILGPESPSAQAVKGEVGKEWNSPARYPADIKREKRKVKSRPYWTQFVCCSSVDPQ